MENNGEVYNRAHKYLACFMCLDSVFMLVEVGKCQVL